MTAETCTWLRQQRESRGWPRREMARRLIQAGQAAGDTMPGITSVCTNIRRWEGSDGISERYKLHYCAAFGIPASQFGSTADIAVRCSPTLLDPRLPGSPAVVYRGSATSDPGGFSVEREVLMTAHESSDHAEQLSQPGIGEETMEQLRADVARLARLSDTGEPLPAFLDTRRVRDRIYRLLDRRMWPRKQTELYFLLGCLNGMMGTSAFRLGYADAAEELNRAGWAYASAIDHHPLMAWLRDELCTYAYFRGRFEVSRDLALNGLQYRSAGPTGAVLHIYHARAASRLGDVDTALQAIRDAHEARNREHNDELLDMGGTYYMSRATYHGMAGAALTEISGVERDAASELERAITLYDEGPGEREEHWSAGKPLACIELAVVRLRSGALDAAADALEPTLALPPALRISDVTMKLAAVRTELAAPIFGGSAKARQLGERIEEFSRETAMAGLHSLSGPG